MLFTANRPARQRSSRRSRLALALLASLGLGDRVCAEQIGAHASSEQVFHVASLEFDIPFDVARRGRQPAEVELWVSEDQGENWSKRASVAPDAHKFRFQAETDGSYLFSVQTINEQGDRVTSDAASTQIIVDTTKPKAALFADFLSDGRLKIDLAAMDAHLLTDSARLRYRTNVDSEWEELAIDNWNQVGDVYRAEVHTELPACRRAVLELSITDRAGNLGQEVFQLEIPRTAAGDQGLKFASTRGGDRTGRSAGPSQPVSDAPYRNRSLSRGSVNWEPQMTPRRAQPVDSRSASDELAGDVGTDDSSRPASTQDSFADGRYPTKSIGSTGSIASTAQAEGPADRKRPARDDEHLQTPGQLTSRGGGLKLAPSERSRSGGFEELPPPSAAPGSDEVPTKSTTEDTAARAAGSLPDHWRVQPPSELDLDNAESPVAAFSRESSLDNFDNRPGLADPDLDRSPGPVDSDVPSGAYAESNRGLPTRSDPFEHPLDDSPHHCDSKRFELHYDIDSRGSQIAKVELWGTDDGGQTWSHWGDDRDRISPCQVEVDEEGLYGFRVVTVDRNGLVSERPRSREDADAWIHIDTTPPQVKITRAVYGEGQQAGKFIIDYTCSDENLADRPILLSYSDRLDGPWKPIAQGESNSGSYVWKVEPGTPDRIYLRLQAIDKAGNLGGHKLDMPIDRQGLVPSGRIRGVRPVR